MAKKSIHDIARLAGVSASTVSNVLNDKGRHSEATRQKVLDIARQEGYQANFAAKALREQRSLSVGVLLPDMSNDFFASIGLAVEQRLFEAGYTTFICNTHNDADRTSRYLRELHRRQVDGLILIGGSGSALFEAGDTPCVSIDASSLLPADVHQVRNDMDAMTHDMTAYLIDQGCTDIALLAVSHDRRRGASGNLLNGYYRALAERGIRSDERLVLIGPHQRSSTKEGEELVGGLLERGVAIDGIVAWGDRIALGALSALKARGLVPGQDCKVIGMDNSLYSRLSTPAITSVERHTAEMAERGVDMLLALIGQQESVETDLVVPFEIVVRETA